MKSHAEEHIPGLACSRLSVVRGERKKRASLSLLSFFSRSSPAPESLEQIRPGRKPGPLDSEYVMLIIRPKTIFTMNAPQRTTAEFQLFATLASYDDTESLV